MAEDLLRPPRRGETSEEVGCEYFDDLASRLFFKQVQYREKYFVMHDLMHDLATFLAGDLYCKFSEELGEREEMSILTHHLSYDHSIPEKICSSSKIESLRTLMYIKHGAYTRKAPATLPGDILSKNKYLRVLSFDRLNVLPDSIDKLIQLRYLGLSGSGIKVLPESLCNLCNLQTLKLAGCSSLTMLPSSLGELINLRYLDLSRSAVETLPESLCNMCNLQTLKLARCSSLTMLPSSLGELINLHYLDLSRSAVETLPESLCSMCNLQALNLEDCLKLTMLPNDMYKLVNLRHLHIRGTPLKEMPKGMGKLNQLHILSKFVVGKQEDNGIQELAALLNLHGSLEIQKLENVVDANQARNARIIDKKHIEYLLLRWSSGDDMVSNTHTDEQDILGDLQPHTGLKVLRIKGYKGKIFPEWIGHSLYQNMTSVTLEYCWNCCVLPSLGQLPSLRSLRIESFSQLKSVGMEFYQNEGDQHYSPIAPFSSLEELIFNNMPSWEEWHLPDSEAFPQLKSLQIRECPMLKEDMVNQVLMRIVSSSSDVSKVRQLEIREHRPRWAKEMRLDGDRLSISGFKCVVEYAFKARIIHHLTSLQEIKFSGCSSVVSLGGNCLPKSLQKLNLFECSQIKLLQQQHKYDLVDLHIEFSCDSLTSLSLDAFPKLENLEIFRCSNLESVSMSEPPHAALQRLSISNCLKFVSFPEAGLAAPNLTHLSVINCLKLEALPPDMNSLLPNLQSLELLGCPNICRSPQGGLPPNLKRLGVGKCEEQLRGLSWRGNLDNLTHLTIYGDGSESRIKSYPEVGLLPRLPSLTNLEIWGFMNLETLECNELLRLTSLQQLHISYCKKLKNMEGAKLPPSLLLLEIDDCGLLGKHCKNKHQQIWSKISHIPTIQVDDDQIF
ncbi:putative disease resistance protein At3g14460 [Arachis stenosperma]|uniref:putative disease resistance protein At3g14460 n=1 Tax=Arachis stenosperma TaxID=217475 RepID=UPI0025AC04B3|nr:putative disease resistance protein At3g14460 [Arachis stenosperma]XP_057745796.1 putative disease resistance protein At3g14460 [Arachis stenosperma]XP_057745797.1 putative disease resistance protein At3g14460 [Arachis stenosperma]XP_057745798.1 putative disease resistance protein At3g14460 [Arachis stenosperma]